MHFEISDKASQILARLDSFMVQNIEPLEGSYLQQLNQSADPWQVQPVIEDLKTKARGAGLWNLFLNDPEHGAGLTTLEYAPLAEQMGQSLIAPEIFNCNAPDTGNMEVLHMYGSEQQKSDWLTPLLDGKIRSAFCMTEPAVASSDATNMEATAMIDGDRVILNGRKWWSTGIGHPNCKILIFMGLTDPAAKRHQQHSMVLVPVDAVGVRIERMLPVFGAYDPPFGHGEASFTDVSLPVDHIIAGPGRGFEIAQGRLGPGRVHHCMRLLGAAEKALQLMCVRSLKRTAFGKPLADLGGNRERIANARLAIDQARLLTLKTAWLIDQHGARGAQSEIAQIKIAVPRTAQWVIDQAIQLFGAEGLSDDTPLAALFASARALRIADGPDAVHRATVAKLELRKYQ